MPVNDVSIDNRQNVICRIFVYNSRPFLQTLNHSHYVNLVAAISKDFVNVYFDIHNFERLNLLQNPASPTKAKHSRLIHS